MANLRSQIEQKIIADLQYSRESKLYLFIYKQAMRNLQ